MFVCRVCVCLLAYCDYRLASCTVANVAGWNATAFNSRRQVGIAEWA